MDQSSYKSPISSNPERDELLDENSVSPGFMSTITSMITGAAPSILPTRKDPIKDLEKKRGTKIITINHIKIASGILSMLDHQQSLTKEDALRFIQNLRSVPEEKTLEIILNTPGGSLSAAEAIVNAMLNHKGKIIVYVPKCAMSAGLIIALAADEVYLEKNAYMGPADPQFALGFSAATVLDYTKRMAGTDSWVTHIVQFAQSSAQQSMDWVKDLISRIYTEKGRALDDKVFESLFTGKQIHERPLFYRDLSELIPFIKEGVPDEIHRLL